MGCHTLSGPPDKRSPPPPRTVHSNYSWSPRHMQEGLGAGFWIYMVSRVSLKGLYGRVRLQGLYGRVSL